MIDYLHGVELTPLRKLLFVGALAGGKEVEDTATGNPLTFLTDLAKPLKELLVAWTPTQSGSGDPSPDNVRPISGMSGVTVWRTGKNLLNIAEFVDNKVWWQGVLVNGYTGYKASNKIPVVPNAKYTLYKSTPGQNQLQYFDADGQYISQNTSALGNEVSKITIPDGVYFIGINLNSESIATAQLEVGETASGYEAYSGASFPVTFPALGKNLFDKNNVVANTTWWKGNRAESNGNNSSAKIPVIPGETYTLARTHTVQGTMCFFDVDGVYVSQDTVHWLFNPSTYTIPDGIYFVGFTVNDEGLDTAMFVKGSSVGSYEPYNATIYGGTLDLVSGVLTATMAITDLGDHDWVYVTSSDQPFMRTDSSDEIKNVIKIPSSSSVVANIVCSALKTVSAYKISAGTATSGIGVHSDGMIRAVYPDMPTIPNNFKTEVTGWKLAYELATPVEYQLTPQQVTALVGTNTVWSDANGDCSVTYVKKG